MIGLLSQGLAGIIIITLLFAAWSDLATRVVPNSTSIVIAVSGLVLRATAGPAALAWSVGLSLLLFCFLVFAHARGILGGGDVKLIAAISLGMPAQALALFLCATAISGGGLALIHLMARRMPHPQPCPAGAPLIARVWTAERWRIRRHAPLPYGIAVAIGGAWAILSNLGS